MICYKENKQGQCDQEQLGANAEKKEKEQVGPYFRLWQRSLWGRRRPVLLEHNEQWQSGLKRGQKGGQGTD